MPTLSYVHSIIDKLPCLTKQAALIDSEEIYLNFVIFKMSCRLKNALFFLPNTSARESQRQGLSVTGDGPYT